MSSLPARLFTLVLVLAWPLAVFGHAIWSGGVLAPGDGLAYYLPIRVIAALAWHAGEPPFWNPFQFSGMPLLATIQSGAFFPGNLPFLFFAPGTAMNLSALLAYAVAGVATWGYALAISLPPAAALLAALVFMGSGYMVAHLEHLTMIQAAGLIPAMLWAVERYCATGRLRFALALAPLLALQIFAGYPQTTAMTALILVPYVLWRALAQGIGPGVRMGLALACAATVGVGLTALQLLPTADLLAASPRGRLSYGELIDHSWPLRELPTLLFPFLYGGVPGELFSVPAWGKGPWRNELMGYAGLGTLMLALLGVPAAWRSAQARFWLAVAGVAGLLALGGQTPLYRLWAMVPGLKIMRVPGRHLLELDFALAMLAGLGLAWLLAARPAERSQAARVAVACVALPMGLIALGLLVGREALAARWQSYVPTGLDLAGALSPAQPAIWVPLVFLVATGAALMLLARDPHPTRQALLVAVLALDLLVFDLSQGWRALIPPQGAPVAFSVPLLSDGPRTLAVGAYPYRDVARTYALRYPMTGALFGAKLVNGYEPLVPTEYARLVGKLAMGGSVGDPRVLSLGHHSLDVLGTRTIRLDRAIYESQAWSGPIETHPRWERLADEGPVVVYTNHRALPRAWRPTRVVERRTPEIALTMREDVAFEPRVVALVEGRVQQGPAWTPGEAWARTVSLNRIAVRTRGTGPGLVVVSEAWQPGWTAHVGERMLPIRKVDGLVIGIEVPSGDQAFELRFEPPAWKRGLAITVGSASLWLLGVLGAFVARRHRKPRRREGGS